MTTPADAAYAPIPHGARVSIDTPLVGLSQWGTVEGKPLAGYGHGVLVHAVRTDTGPAIPVLRTHLTDWSAVLTTQPPAWSHGLHARLHLPPGRPL